MSLTTLLLVAVGLAADAFAVSVGKGLSTRRLSPRYAVLLGLTFGLFQAVMPVLGWLLGAGLRDQVTDVDHWIAFGLLSLIGAKMIWEALADRGDGEVDGDDGRIAVRELLVLGLATSIDALAVGIGFAFLEISILGAAALIGVVTFVLSVAGVYLGHRVGARLRGPAEVAGGVILIGIGAKILLDHLAVW